jgi:hypothetical protein
MRGNLAVQTVKTFLYMLFMLALAAFAVVGMLGTGVGLVAVFAGWPNAFPVLLVGLGSVFCFSLGWNLLDRFV